MRRTFLLLRGCFFAFRFVSDFHARQPIVTIQEFFSTGHLKRNGPWARNEMPSRNARGNRRRGCGELHIQTVNSRHGGERHFRAAIKASRPGTWTTAFGGSPCRPPEPPNAAHDTRRRRHPACNPPRRTNANSPTRIESPDQSGNGWFRSRVTSVCLCKHAELHSPGINPPGFDQARATPRRRSVKKPAPKSGLFVFVLSRRSLRRSRYLPTGR